jgi:hypothetical protein
VTAKRKAPAAFIANEARMDMERRNEIVKSAVLDRPSMQPRIHIRAPAGLALPAVAAGALAVGALAIGALAIGSLAIGRLAIGKINVKTMEIDDLTVRRLRILERGNPPGAQD